MFLKSVTHEIGVFSQLDIAQGFATSDHISGQLLQAKLNAQMYPICVVLKGTKSTFKKTNRFLGHIKLVAHRNGVTNF